jgi:hypothetical protein
VLHCYVQGLKFNLRMVNILHRVGYQTDIRNVFLCCISLFQDAIPVQYWFVLVLSTLCLGLPIRAHFHGRLELDMRVQPALQRALLKYRLCRDWRDWRPNWISFSTQPIACLHGNKVTAFLFCPPFCPRFPPVQASHGNQGHSQIRRC